MKIFTSLIISSLFIHTIIAGPEVTGFSAEPSVSITKSEIQTSLSTNQPVYFLIGYACVYTDDSGLDFDLSATATGNYLANNQFQIYNALLGEDTSFTMQVSSTNATSWVNITNNTALPLSNHADEFASGTNCTNKLNLRGSISASNIRVLKPGTYQTQFTLSVNDYTG